MSAIDELIQQAVTFGQTGNKPEAKKILAQVVMQEPKNTRAWYLLSQVVETKEQIEYCLNKVLEINPTNQQAIKRLNSIRATTSTTASTIENQQPLLLTHPIKVAGSQNNSNVVVGLLGLLGLLGLVVVCCLVVSLLNTDTIKTSKNKKDISDISYNTIVINHEQMTSIQWDTYQESITGKRVQWQGWIVNIAKDITGTNLMWIDMDGGGDESRDVFFEFPESESLKYSKGKYVIFQGDIGGSADFFGLILQLENAEIISE